MRKELRSRSLLVLVCSIVIFGCSTDKDKSTTTTTDSLENKPVYFALPLGKTLEQYRAMYKLESYRSEIDSSVANFIPDDCAVVVNLTPEEIERLKVLGVDNESLDLKRKYSETVAKMIQAYGIETVVSTKRFFSFNGANVTWNLDVKRDTVPESKFILFKNKKDPIILPDVLVTRAEVESYFEVSK